MPPKQRQSRSKEQQQQEKGKRGGGEGRGGGGKEPSSQPQDQQKRKKDGVSWMPVFKRLGAFLLVFLIPALLNYAALNQEARMLLPKGIVGNITEENTPVLEVCNITL